MNTEASPGNPAEGWVVGYTVPIAVAGHPRPTNSSFAGGRSKNGPTGNSEASCKDEGRRLKAIRYQYSFTGFMLSTRLSETNSAT